MTIEISYGGGGGLALVIVNLWIFSLYQIVSW